MNDQNKERMSGKKKRSTLLILDDFVFPFWLDFYSATKRKAVKGNGTFSTLLQEAFIE